MKRIEKRGMEEEEREREREEKRRRASRSPGVQRPTTVVLWRLTSGNWCGHGGKKKTVCGIIGNFGKTQVSSAASKFYFYRRPPERKGNGLRNCFYTVGEFSIH